MSYHMNREDCEVTWVIGDDDEVEYVEAPKQTPDIAALKRLADSIPDKKIEPRVFERTPRPDVPFPRRLIEDVCEALDLCPKTMLQDSRWRRYVEGRVVIIMLLRERDPLIYSFPNIARIINRKCHSSVIHLFRNWDIFYKRNPDLLALYRAMGGKH